MRDIVATIQAEQDEAIRADLAGILVVGGGPGTGKTAVALHRAAYLLYTHRKRLASQGVLLVGPSSIFLRYIDEVLPSLGEDEVSLATPAALKPRLKVRGTEPDAAAAVKGDVRMAKVIAARDRRSRAADAARRRRQPRRLRAADASARLDPHHRAGARAAGHAQRAAALRRQPRVRPLQAGVPACAGARLPRRPRPPRRRRAAARAHRRPVGSHGRGSHHRRRAGARRGRPARVGGRARRPACVACPTSVPRSTACGRSSAAPSSCATCSGSRHSSDPPPRACSRTRSRRCCSASAAPTSPRSRGPTPTSRWSTKPTRCSGRRARPVPGAATLAS